MRFTYDGVTGTVKVTLERDLEDDDAVILCYNDIWVGMMQDGRLRLIDISKDDRRLLEKAGVKFSDNLWRNYIRVIPLNQVC